LVRHFRHRPIDARPGLFYFAESDTTPAFSSPRVYFMGASRNLYLQLGNQTLYWRAYSQYVGSLPSAPITFGSPPTAVAGGGSAGPAPLPSSGKWRVAERPSSRPETVSASTSARASPATSCSEWNRLQPVRF